MSLQLLAEARRRCEAFEEGLRAYHGASRAGRRQRDYDSVERLGFQYRQLLNHQALIRHRYPNSELLERLDATLLEGTLVLREDPQGRAPSIRVFVGEIFPRAIRSTAPTIAIITGLFVAAVIFGLGATAVQPDLGWLFVNAEMKSALESGELWTESIFSVAPGALLASGIATNNMTVALTGWAGGAVAGIGAFIVVVLNGLMFGSVIAVTSRYGLADHLFDFIAAHGPLELTLILVTAGAGLHIGSALIVAGEEPRSTALRTAGREALVVLIGCLPWILMLGVVEGFVSPAPFGVALKGTIGIGLECLFLLVAWRPVADE